ncbi:unnamed protein product [Toxocara canis]|uniref:Doublecortin domain-containing protein n=1 Tax=Toxocara canis TaxID=6265 RepID=A0A183V0C4_TOXCA|nr:unnamed protein product [Toxocara canis]
MDASTNRSATLLPNLPDPVNGKIKTYDCSHRTFTRPYSAKTVFFYKEGDNYFTGVRVPVSKARYRNMDSLLDDLNSNIQMPFGVRRLTTPLGRTHIETIDQLQHLGRYPLLFEVIVPMNWISKHYEMLSIKMLFVLNGKPSRIYRALLNPMRMKTFDALLEEVSQGLQIAIFKIYTYAGHRVLSIDELMSMSEARVLAVPRHERPILKKHAVAPLVTSLPPISQEKMSKSTSAATSRKLTTGTKSSSNRVTSPYNANSIERPRQVKSTKRMPLTRQTVSMKREATALANDSSKRKRRDKVNTNDTFVVDSPRVLKMVGKDDNDSGRPQSPEEVDLERSKSSENQTEVTDENANKVEGEVGDENTPSRGGHQDSTLGEEPKEVQKSESDINGDVANKASEPRQQKDVDELEAEPDAEEGSPRETGDDVDEGIGSGGSANDGESRRNKAATTIQAHFRGYLMRQQLNNS